MENEIIKTENQLIESDLKEGAKAVSEVIKQQVKDGQMNFSDAAKEFIHAGVAAKTVDPENKAFIKKVTSEKEDELFQSFKSKKLFAEADTLLAKAKKAEAFYTNWRPILEFDFNALLGKEPKNTEYPQRSYGIFYMMIILFFLSPLYFLISATIAVIAGIKAIIISVIGCFNAICEQINKTVKLAKWITTSLFIIVLLSLFIYVVLNVLDGYFKIPIWR